MNIFKNNYFTVIYIFLIIFGLFFNYFFLYFFLGLIFFVFFKKRNNYTYFIISIIFFTFVLLELIFKDKEFKSDYLTVNNIKYDIDKNYGYHPVKNQIFSEEIFYKKNLIKKNVYTIDEYGHRKVENKNKSKNCIIFHGGSITFGQSLSDNETLPYYTKILLSENYNVFNFAFNGYGPHQFLSKLENLNQKDINHCKKIIILYQFIFDHIGRTSGKRSWGDKSPRYVLNNNQLIQKGFFSDFPFKFVMKIRKNFRHSKVSNIFFNLQRVNQKDTEIYLSILKKIELVTKKKFLDTRFIYLVWNKNINNNVKLLDFFNNSESIFIDDLEIDDNIKYNNIPGDNHPKKEFNLIIANVLKKIIY